MKYYRLVDSWGEPYATGYNETDLHNLAEAMVSLGGEEEEYDVKTLYKLLSSGEREFLFSVQESDTPFVEEDCPALFF